MKLKDLISKIIIQGDVQISVWDEEDLEEVDTLELFLQDNLSVRDVEKYKNLEVKYMFAAPDNMLHIELKLKLKH